MKYVTESITLPTPPDHLLEYDYVRTKANKCLDKLANSTLDENVREQVEKWKTLIQNQILLVHESQFEEKMDGHLQQLFRGKVELRKQSNDIKACIKPQYCYKTSETNSFVSHLCPLPCGARKKVPREGFDTCHTQMKTTFLSSQVCIVILETEQNEEESCCLSDRAKSLLSFLKSSCSHANLLYVCIILPTDTQAKALNASGNIHDLFGQRLTVTSFESSDEFLTQHIHQCFLQNLQDIEGKIRIITEEHGLDDTDLSTSNPFEHTLETFANLKRILSQSNKRNSVDCTLQTTFDSMRDSGYAGHVYINRRLTIYVSKSAKGVTKDALIEAAEELFDDVKCEYVWKTNTIKSCTLQHGEKCENVSQRRGTLGTFAKNCTGNLYALTVPHFVKEGDIVYRDTIEIGTCIWPRMDQGMSLMNEIAVVNIRKQFEENCTLIHETLSGEARHFGLYTQNPRVYSQVFKGRQNTGFMTGRIVSSEARLPYKDGPLQAYLIEGDDQTPFIIGGDSGDVVKLVREENGELKGVSVIFGEALELPGIERGTCITIPLRAAVNRFEACYGTNLTFR